MVAGNRPGTHFNKVGWANLKTKFLKETDLNYESKQFKNKWEAMKREWGLWAKLKGKEIGLGWDPIKKTIQASDDWWDAKIQENPDVAKFREEGPKHLDEMEFLFEDVVATGVGAWAPSEDINNSYNDRYNDEDNGNEEEGLEDELNDESTPSSAMRQKRRKVGKGSGASQLSTQLERIINVFEEEKTNEIAHRNNVPSISTCLAVLKQLPGLEVGSDIFFIATRLMAKRSNREIFMGLEDSALQLGWLKTHSLADMISNSSTESSSTESLISNTNVSDEKFENKQKVAAKRKKKTMTLITIATCVDYFLKYIVKNPRRTSRLTGSSWVNELLNGHPIRCYQQFRMKKLVFLHLCDVLQNTYNLKTTKGIGIHEQVGIFLYIIGQPGSIRNAEERFQHSGETISRQFHYVLDAVCKLAQHIIQPTDPQFTDTPVKIKNDERYYPYFKNCIGAIDGTHIPVVVPADKKISYFGRKGITTTNVMA
ncbi:hypothetical protein S83_023314, partial [Arachis hypogaea]